MNEVRITVDVYCNWTAEPKAYRVYFDDDLLTERTYVWRNSDHYIQENIIVLAEHGQHSLRIVPVDPSFTGFYTRHITVNGQVVPHNQIVL